MSALLAPTAIHTSQYNTHSASAAQAVDSEISVITRIDYNLRFNKKTVMVVTDKTELYTQLSRDFLTHLSDSQTTNLQIPINVAFLSASTKLNDLQVRCRIIEQLFVSSLFDPEKSLAVSVIEFAKKQGEAISIVVEHAQYLSLQLKYELCQMVELANKNKLQINVVSFGLMESVQDLAINPSLVKNKLVVIAADSGQIINLNNRILLPNDSTSSLTQFQKVSLLSLVIMMISVSVVSYLYFMKDNDANENGKSEREQPLADLRNIEVVDRIKPTEKVINNTATSKEINAALIAIPPIKKNMKDIEAVNSSAQVRDVFYALSMAVDEGKYSPDKKEVAPLITKELSSSIDPLAKAEENELSSAYYVKKGQTYNEGYMVQVAGFSDKVRWEKFIEDNSSAALYSYKKMLNGNEFIVVTSVVYPTKEFARDAMLNFTKLNGAAEPWLKSISSVLEEINTFKG